MGRSVYDVATLFSVMSGWDAEDLTTFNPMGHFPQTNWAQELKQRDVKGKRIGVLREMLPVGEQYAEGLALFERALEDLKKAGAFIVDPIMTGSPNISIDTGQGRGRTAEYVKIAYTDAYLARLGTNGKYKTTREMMEKVGFDKFSGGMAAALQLGAPGADPEYAARYKSRQAYIALISETYDKYALDAFVLPFTIAPAPAFEGGSEGRTGRGEGRTAGAGRVERQGVNNITSTLGLPAVVVPGGYTPSKNFPIATQFFGKPFTDLKVLQVAYGYEQTTKRRKTPETTPPLPGEIFDYKASSEKATVASSRE
jgi:amidase